MARVLSTAFCVALLAATAGAFALTQGAKVELSPIYDTSIPHKVFSPVCNCPTNRAPISFRLRESEHIEVWMERNGKRAETLIAGRRYPRGPVSLSFNGVSGGVTLPDGGYKPVIRLPHRTFTLPNTIVIDTVPPVVHVHRHINARITPGTSQRFHVAYSVSEHAHGVLYVDGKQVELTYKEPLSGELTWDGKLGGIPAKPGSYTLAISAQDLAGNRAKPISFAVVTVQYLALGRTRISAKPGAPFALLVISGAPRLEILFHGKRRAVEHRGESVTLHFRAPAKPGVYTLYVSAVGHAARATVVVR